ncbi:MAG TPA: phage tail protein [Pyrinomonadaceae bacterium]|nr:phage tail protein [Pyrinomonadaceae bacterium]
MKADKLKSYRFATEAQWNACLFVQADRESLRKGGGVQPFAPYGRPAALYGSRGGHAPVVTRTREIFWRDDQGRLHRVSACDDIPETFCAPGLLARAKRIVSTTSGLWVIEESSNVIERYEEDTLTRLLSVRIKGAKTVDIASDGHDALWVLTKRKDSWQTVPINSRGQEGKPVNFKGISNAKAFVFLRRKKRFVVLAGDEYQRLYWFDVDGGSPLFSLPVGATHPCFKARILGSDSTDRVFMEGADDRGLGAAYVLIIDADGDSLGDVPLHPQDAPATGIAARGNHLLVTGKRGLLQFTVAEVVPEGAEHAQCMLMTPSLFSPDREDRRRWLRVEATASLPEGSTLEISWTATDDDVATRDRLKALANDDSIPANQVVAKVLNEPDMRRGRTVFHGTADSEKKSEPIIHAAKLFEVSERYLWVCVTLTAPPGARLPLLSELNVFYPGRTLMEDLPSIYQREEEQPDSFLRALVGVLETTTHGLDRTIGSMGRNVHPATATEPWLDFIARWLGVPWDDGLTVDQKRAIVMRAPDLAKSRGTRAGLEALLECLIPGTPRRFRVTDATADFGFAVVGGDACAGSALPAMLGGHTRWSPELDSRAVLGYVRLPCDGQLEDGAWQLAGRVQVEIVATAAERIAWRPWLLALIKEMVPLTARVELRWTNAQALRSDRLDDTMKLESPPEPHLGTDAITGLARLPERGISLSACGAAMGSRLG